MCKNVGRHSLTNLFREVQVEITELNNVSSG